MNTKTEKLKQFILDNTYKKKFTIKNLDYSLGLEKDLGIAEEWAEDFLYNYSDMFGVDLVNFNFGLYFYTDGPFLYWIYRILPNLNPKKKELTIGDLIAGIEAGKLDEEVINAYRKSLSAD